MPISSRESIGADQAHHRGGFGGHGCVCLGVDPGPDWRYAIDLQPAGLRAPGNRRPDECVVAAHPQAATCETLSGQFSDFLWIHPYPRFFLASRVHFAV